MTFVGVLGNDGRQYGRGKCCCWYDAGNTSGSDANTPVQFLTNLKTATYYGPDETSLGLDVGLLQVVVDSRSYKMCLVPPWGAKSHCRYSNLP